LEQASSAITDLRDLDVNRHDHALLLERAIELRDVVSETTLGCSS